MATPAWMNAPEVEARTTQSAQPAWATAPPVSITPTSVDRPEAVDRFASGFANAVNPVPGIEAIANDPQGIKHGIEQNVFEPQRQQFVKAGEAAQGKGEFSTMNPLERASETIGHGVAGITPMFGPAAANAGDQIGEGDVAGGLGSAAGLLMPAAIPDLMHGVGKGLSRGAEPLAENALGIRNVDRKFSRSPGRAALDETSGISQGTVTDQANHRIADLTAQRDAALTASPNQISLRPARTVVNDAITKAAAGNSDTSHLIPIREQLEAPKPGFAGATQPSLAGPLTISELQDPMNALAIRQRLGKDFTKFDMARPVSNEAKAIGNRAYGALTDEIHSAVPDSAPFDRRISNLIPVKEGSAVKEINAGPLQRMAGRFSAHTGALAGGLYGAHEFGLPGAVAGIAIPELLADPTAQMAAARSLDTAGKVIRNPFVTRASQAAQLLKPQAQGVQ